jgi:hypothetical protein
MYKRFNLGLPSQIKFMNLNDPLYFKIHTQYIIMVKYFYDNTNMGPDIIKMIMDYYGTFIRNKKIHNLIGFMDKPHFLPYQTGLYDDLKMKELNVYYKDINDCFKTKKPDGSGKNGSVTKIDKLNDIKHSEIYKHHQRKHHKLMDESLCWTYWDKVDKKYVREKAVRFIDKIIEERELKQMNDWLNKAPEFMKNNKHIDSHFESMKTLYRVMTREPIGYNEYKEDRLNVKRLGVPSQLYWNLNRYMNQKIKSQWQGLEYDFI